MDTLRRPFLDEGQRGMARDDALPEGDTADGAAVGKEGGPAPAAVATPQGLSWDDAVEIRKKLLLYEYDRDKYGIRVPGTARPFKLGAHARDIGRESVGLGVYFTSVHLFILLVVGLSLLAIPDLVLNIRANNFADSYTVVVNNNTADARTCRFPWANDSDTSTLVTKMTLGNYCPDSDFSSPLDCPSICSITTAVPVDPCNVTITTDENAPSDKCFLELDDTKTKDIDGAQLIILLVGQFAMYVWLLMLKRIQSVAAEQINASVVTAGDYSVLVRGLRRQDIDSTHLIEFSRHYGEVVNAVHISAVGRPIELGRRLETQRCTLEELKVQAAHPKAGTGYLKLFGWLYWGIMGGFSYGEAAAKKMEKTVEATKKLLDEEEKKPVRGTGYGIVTFNYEAHCKNMLRDHEKKHWQKLESHLTCGLARFGDFAPRVRGRRITVHRAPEPTDLWWENTWVSGNEKAKRFYISNGLTFLAMAAGAVVQFYLARAAQNIQEDRGEIQFMGASEQDKTRSFFDTAGLQTLSVLSGLAVVVINIAVAIIMNVFSFYERHPTRSGREKWLVLKLSVFYLINSFLVPVLAGSARSKRSEQEELLSTWYSRGGLIEQAFYIQITNAIVPDLLALFNPMERLNVHIFSKFARTQNILDMLLKPQPFNLAERYAAAVKTLGLAILYLPALPISPFIAVLGLTFSYWADKVVALRRAQKPHQLNGDIMGLINRLLRFLPLAQLILMERLYFSEHDWKVPVFVTGLVVFCLFSFIPISKVLKLEGATKFGDWGTANASFADTIGHIARPTMENNMNDLMKAMLPEVMEGEQQMTLHMAEVYEPACPEACGKGFVDKVIYHFNLPEHPYAAIPDILEGQKLDTGDKATEAPPQKGALMISQASLEPGDLDAATRNAPGELEAGLAKEGPPSMKTHRYPVVGHGSYAPYSTFAPMSGTAYPANDQPGAPPPPPPSAGVYSVPNPYASDGTRSRALPGSPTAPGSSPHRPAYPVIIHRTR